MESSRAEKAFVAAFATSAIVLLVVGSATDAPELYVTGLILLMPWTIPVLWMIFPTLGLALIVTEPMRAAGFDELAHVLAGVLGWTLVAATIVGAAIGQGMLLVLGGREVRKCLARGRTRYCRHDARPA